MNAMTKTERTMKCPIPGIVVAISADARGEATTTDSAGKPQLAELHRDVGRVVKMAPWMKDAQWKM